MREIKVNFDALIEVEAEIEYLRMVIRKLAKKYPTNQLSRKTNIRLREKALAIVEYKYQLHEVSPKH